MTTIHTTGTAESHILAERATITARVSAVSRDRSVSIEAATHLHNQIVQRAEQLRASGDATWYAADPISTWARKTYAEGKNSDVIIEHVTSSAVRIKLQNLDLVSEFVTELSEAGAETGVDWALTERTRREHERHMRKAAVDAARVLADDYAEALGEVVTEVVSISDTLADAHVPVARFAAAAVPAGGSAEVTTAEITVSATVKGVFESGSGGDSRSAAD